MYYIRTWYKAKDGKIFHQDTEYPEVLEIMECTPYRAEVVKLTPTLAGVIYNPTLDVLEAGRLKTESIEEIIDDINNEIDWLDRRIDGEWLNTPNGEATKEIHRESKKVLEWVIAKLNNQNPKLSPKLYCSKHKKDD